MIDLSALFRLRPERAADYLAAKGLRLTGPYWELDGPQHSHVFTVAHLAKLDVLADIKAAVQGAIDAGETQRWFRQQLVETLQKKGWWGPGEWTDPLTGDTKMVQQGSLRRLETIYRTNLQSAYMAGRHRQAMEQADRAPWAQYIAVRDSRTRPAHAALNGKVFRLDSPAWAVVSPTNSYNCRCRARYLSDAELAARNLKPVTDTRILEREIQRPDGLPIKQRGVSVSDPTAQDGRATLWADAGWDHLPGSDGAERALVARALEKAETLGSGIKATVKGALEQVAKVAAPVQEVKTVAPVFQAQKTAKDAAKYAVSANLADFSDYTGVKPEVANAWNQSLFDHATRFPELRANQKFSGTVQAQHKRWREIAVDRLHQQLVRFNPHLDSDYLRKSAEARIKPVRLSDSRYAHSWNQDDVRGIAVNTKWGKDPAAFMAQLERDVGTNWHPQGTASIKAVVDHELGHQLDDLLSLNKDPDILALWGMGKPAIVTGLSRYAQKNIYEMIAEGWAEYLNNPSPRPLALKIGEIIERRYKDRYPS